MTVAELRARLAVLPDTMSVYLAVGGERDIYAISRTLEIRTPKRWPRPALFIVALDVDPMESDTDL